MTVSAITRLTAQGSERPAWDAMELDPSDFASELPRQFWRLDHSEDARGLYIGEWTTTPMQEAFGPYPCDEFMILLEGHVRLIDAAENVTEVAPGQAFAIGRDTEVSWKQDDFCRKFFVIHQPPVTAPTGSGGLTRDICVLNAKEADENQGYAFQSDDGRMTVGYHALAPSSVEFTADTGNRLIRVEDGRGSLIQPDGVEMAFAAGDVFLVPAGLACTWQNDDPVRLLVCRVGTGAE